MAGFCVTLYTVLAWLISLYFSCINVHGTDTVHSITQQAAALVTNLTHFSKKRQVPLGSINIHQQKLH